MAKTVRIQKALGDAGILSRRKAEEYIKAGRITVNGHRAQPGNPIDTRKDQVAIDGRPVVFPRHKENLYLMLNKPRGYVTTNSDDLGRKCVAELVEDAGARVYPIGRLDRDSEGLLLLTNDGQFANLIMHPSHRVGKTYRVTVGPDISDEQAAHLAAGVDLGEGERSGPATVLVLEKEPGRVVLQLTIAEGKNREIRRMCQGVGLTVMRLKRVAVGPVKLGMLQPGKWRELKPSEVIALRNAARPASQQEPIPQDEEGGPKLGSFGKPDAPKHGGQTGRGGSPRGGQKGDYAPRQGGKPKEYGGKPKSYNPSYGDKPKGARPDQGGKPKEYGGKPKGYNSSCGDKPKGARPDQGGKPKEYGNKPKSHNPNYGDKPRGARPDQGGKSKEYGGKPKSYNPSYGDKPKGARPNQGGKPKEYGGKPKSYNPSYGDKPKGARPDQGGKPKEYGGKSKSYNPNYGGKQSTREDSVRYGKSTRPQKRGKTGFGGGKGKAR